MNPKELLFTKFNLLILLFWIFTLALGYFHNAKPLFLFPLYLFSGILWAIILIMNHKK